MTACNYDKLATKDDGSCTFAEDFYDCDGNCLNDEDMDGVCDELKSPAVPAVRMQLRQLATDDDGSCTVDDACDDGNDMTENDMIDENCECMGTEIVDGVDMVTATLVFPNPAQDVLNLQFEGTVDGVVRLVTLDGRVAVEERWSPGSHGVERGALARRHVRLVGYRGKPNPQAGRPLRALTFCTNAQALCDRTPRQAKACVGVCLV